ncbi:MAG: type II toxin-antitoxin system VapC family toxin [Acidobacteriota bacterium]
MTLVDTSVWIEHLKQGNERLAVLLEGGRVFCHRFVIGELACGRLRNRDELLNLLGALPATPIVEHDEVLTLIAERKLAGRGLGWIDMHLLASALLAHCKVWTLDKTLAAAATELKLT